VTWRATCGGPYEQVTDLGSTNGTYVDGFPLRKGNRFRVYNGGVVRLGAENVNGEPFVQYKLALTGANEEAKNSEVGTRQPCRHAIRHSVKGPC
jgi:pSer/pThr/pTyr-binding forkhead associated (FHA) protein